ncbi:MAG: hypothetical protein O3C40_09525 [Planctomycetota bacterium]|nr:hypothetical protein [Planctomycetota bacterium]
MLRILNFTAILISLASFLDAEDTLPTLDKTVADKISYRADVWPILKRHCWGCHSGEVVLLDLLGEQPPRRSPTESDLLSHVEFSSDGKLLVRWA